MPKYCIKCYKKKDKRNSLICKACTEKQNQPKICKCGKIREVKSKRYCRDCSNKYNREWRRSHPLTEAQKFRGNVRRKTKMRIKRGLLIPYPCEVCGKKKVEAHHDDYNKPYDIRWLCFKHHREYHKEIRRKELKMIEFSAISKFKLATCHPDLVTLFNEVLQLRNCTILEGYRGKQAQEAAFEAGKSKLHYPNGNHNKNPSMAVDAAPWPIPEWNDEKEFIYFAGIVVGVACKLFDECKMTHRIRWGGAWDGIDKMNTGQMLSDLDHFELIPLMEAKSNVTV